MGFSDKQKIFMLTCALEQIKDAPIAKGEIYEICQDVLYLTAFGNYSPNLSPWGKKILGFVLQLGRKEDDTR